MANKKPTNSFKYLLAFIFGLVIMIIVYGLFEGTAKRTRAGSAETVGAESGIVKTANIVQIAGVEEAPLSPSAFLGVEILSVNSVIAKQLSLSNPSGVLVNSVIADSPAEKAGLKRGDVIISLDGNVIEDIDGFRQIMAELNPGERVRIVFIRNGQKDMVYAELVKSPTLLETATGNGSSKSHWGVALSPLSPTLRKSLNIPPDIGGVAILSVAPGGSADQAGLMPGNLIMGIDKTPISDMDDFFSSLSADRDSTALLDVYSQGQMRYVPMDSSGVTEVVDQAQSRTTLRQRIFSIFAGGTPFATDDDDEEGPKGGKFAQDDIQLTTGDNPAFNRPSTVPGDENTGGTSGWTPGTPGGTSNTTGMNRPSEVPPQLGGPTNDVVLFIGLLLLVILYLAYREYHRPVEVGKNR